MTDTNSDPPEMLLLQCRQDPRWAAGKITRLLIETAAKDTEIVRLRVALEEIARKDAEIARLREVLTKVRDVIDDDPDNLNLEVIVDTVWVSEIETMVDYINAALRDV